MRSEDAQQVSETRSFLPRRLIPSKKAEPCKKILETVKESDDASRRLKDSDDASRRLILGRKGGWCYSAVPALAQWERSFAFKEDKGLRPCKSWYGSLQDEEFTQKDSIVPTVAECTALVSGGSGGGREPGSPPAPRRPLDLFIPRVSRNFPIIRRATSRDSALEKKPEETLRKCSTVIALTEPLKPHNRLRTPSLCSKCSSILSLVGVGGSRYSLDALGFVPVVKSVELKAQVCKLCLEDTQPEDLSAIGGCGCTFCTKCMQCYVQFEVVNGAYEISCPDAECRISAALTLDEIQELVDEETWQKHLKFRRNHEVAMDQGKAFCPRAGCDTVCCVRAASPVHCPTCKLDFCSECNQEWHPGVPCSAAGPNSSAPLLPDGDLIKWCPMCQVPIEKDEGCAQMMCKRCKHVFCWYCLASLDDDFLLRHYDKGPCKNKLGHSRASVIWHRAQVVGIFAGFGLLLLVASPLLLLAAPCIVCCKCRLCNTSGAKNLDDAEELDQALNEREETIQTPSMP